MRMSCGNFDIFCMQATKGNPLQHSKSYMKCLLYQVLMLDSINTKSVNENKSHDQVIRNMISIYVQYKLLGEQGSDTKNLIF